VDLVMSKPAKLTEIRAALANFFSRQETDGRFDRVVERSPNDYRV
jgi:hypothetical protein